MSDVHYEEHAPPGALEPFVLCFWEFRVAEDYPGLYPHVVPPDGCVALVYFRMAGSPMSWVKVVGPRMTELRVEVPPGGRYWGVRLWPDAAGLVSGGPAAQWRDQVLDAADVVPDLAMKIKDRLDPCRTTPEAMSAWFAVLQALNLQPSALDPLARAVLRTLVATNGQTAIEAVAESLGVGERRLQRRFTAAVGLTPKQFARLRRLRAVAVQAVGSAPPSWATIAATQGFADQAHLIREFAQLVGHTPTRFMERVGRIRHERLVP
jgi:AraC-like DNA-binding protein